MSEPVNGASERSERSKAERCGASEPSERCERTNVASDRVALSKRDRLGLGRDIVLDLKKKRVKVTDKFGFVAQAEILKQKTTSSKLP